MMPHKKSHKKPPQVLAIPDSPEYILFKERINSITPITTERAFDKSYYHEGENLKDLIYVEWVVGGSHGGSCWDEDHHYSISSDPEPEFEEFNKILMEVCPEISYLRYLDMTKIIHGTDYTDNEYYGNHTNYQVKYILVKEMYEYMKMHKLYTDPEISE